MPMSKHRPHAPADVKKERTHRLQIWQYINVCVAEKNCNCRSPAYRCQMTVWHEVKVWWEGASKEKNLGSRPARNINSACKSLIDRRNMYAKGESSQNAVPKPPFPLSHWFFEIPLQPWTHDRPGPSCELTHIHTPPRMQKATLSDCRPDPTLKTRQIPIGSSKFSAIAPRQTIHPDSLFFSL